MIRDPKATPDAKILVTNPRKPVSKLEIKENGSSYIITEEKLLFEELQALTDYTFKVRAVNKSGASDWTEIKTTTKSNPLEFALKGVTAETTAENLGEKAKINGSGTLFKIVMKAKRNVKFELKATDGIIADKFLNTEKF